MRHKDEHRVMRAKSPTYDNVVGLELVRLRLQPFGAESLAVDEGAVGAFHVLYEDLDDGMVPSARHGHRAPIEG